MKYDDRAKEDLHHLQDRFDAKLEQVRDMLGPDLAQATSEDVEQMATARLARMEPAERLAMQIKAAVAYSELRTLVAEMQRHLDSITEEMGRNTNYRNAASAYSRTRQR